jgi:hypothetical protein
MDCQGEILCRQYGDPCAAEYSQSADVTFTAVVGDRYRARCPVFGSAHWITVKQL